VARRVAGRAIHFAHNALVLGSGVGDDFQLALKGIASSVTTHVMKPGDTRLITT
jgi:hypothetical protein